MHKLLIVSDDAEAYRELIAPAAPELDVHIFRSGDPESVRFAREMDILFTWKFPRELLAEARRLRWIQSTGAGVDHIMAARPLPDNVVVTRMVDVFGPAMAEYVLGYLFAVTLDVPRVLAQQRERRWAAFPVPLLRGKTAVVVGLGNIGREVCRTLGAAGLRVIGVSRSGKAVPEAAETAPASRLDEVLPRADFLVLVIPATEESRGLIDSRRLALLPPRSWVINIGRGAVVSERDLIESLRAGRIGGAVLDVFEREPLPPESPLWSLENVIVTPHHSGTDDVPVNLERFLANYRRFAAGRPLEGVADLERGY